MYLNKKKQRYVADKLNDYIFDVDGCTHGVGNRFLDLLEKLN